MPGAGGRIQRLPANVCSSALPSFALRGGGSFDQSRSRGGGRQAPRSEEHTSELQSLMRISYAVFCLKKNSIYEYCVGTVTCHNDHESDLLKNYLSNKHLHYPLYD